ncbi:MAG: hypothetical protein DRJ01_15275, partial [Bacteroidetes bacterium]
EKAVVVIENKIHSKESFNQLNDYFKKSKDVYGDKEITYVYLTIDGDAPSNDNYIPISYEYIEQI